MIRIQKILYPTDFSSCSAQAFRHALFLARKCDAELHMLYAVVLHEADPANPDRQFPAQDELLKNLYAVADSEMARLSGGLEDHGITICQRKRRGYAPGPVILEYAAEIDADLIVMGTHGHRVPARLFLGSVAEETVRHSLCPVLTLRQKKEERDLDAVRKIVVPVDFSRHSAAGIQTAKEMAALLGAELRLLHVVEFRTLPSFYGPIPVASEEIQRKALDELARLSEESSGPEVPFECQVVTGGAAHEILEYVQAEGDMLVIPTHGHTGIERMFLGSTAERVVRMAPTPVLTVKSFGKPIVSSAGAETHAQAS